MASKRISGLCQSFLPAEFELVKRMAPGIQRFLEQNLPEGVNKCVTLLTLNQHEIVIAANSPMVANYLRLHGKEIRQQLRETFNLEQSLRFRTIPDSLLKLEKQTALRQPEPVGTHSIEALEANAKWIEDEDLKAAMLSLAESLKSN